MGGSDQWGNITTGTELIRRMGSGEAHAVTSPLLTKADGSKFGKSEGGNVWLDPKRTSPYKFYQFWLNSTDEDAPHLLRTFTTRSREDIDVLMTQHAAAPHKRVLQRELAADITRRAHGEEELNGALAATEILFGNATAEALAGLTEQQWLDVFDGVPQAEVVRDALATGIPVAELLSEVCGFLPSKSEARRALKENSIAVNREKVGEDRVVTQDDLLGGRFILLQRGKKNYFLVKVVA
jgi:tyrosyl-tRNA synthetase